MVRVLTSGQQATARSSSPSWSASSSSHAVDLAAVGVGCRSTDAQRRDARAAGIPDGLVERVSHGVQRERRPPPYSTRKPNTQWARLTWWVALRPPPEQRRRPFGHIEQHIGVVGAPCHVAEPGEQVLEYSSHHGVGAALEVPLQLSTASLDPLDAVVDIFVERAHRLGLCAAMSSTATAAHDGPSSVGTARRLA